jgi:molybdenum cofactor biosynthesis enzyme
MLVLKLFSNGYPMEAIKAVSGNVLNVYMNGTTGLNVNVLVIGS